MLKMICCIDLRLYFENDVLEGVEDGAGLEVGLAYQLVLTDLETDFLASFNVWLVKFLSHSVKSKMEVLNFWADAVSAWAPQLLKSKAHCTLGDTAALYECLVCIEVEWRSKSLMR